MTQTHDPGRASPLQHPRGSADGSRPVWTLAESRIYHMHADCRALNFPGRGRPVRQVALAAVVNSRRKCLLCGTREDDGA